MPYGDDPIYGSWSPYGAEGSSNPPTPPPVNHQCEGVCGEGWRFETTDFATGRIKKVLHPISAEWTEDYTSPGQGSLMVATKDYSADDVWPNKTGIYISRMMPDGTRKAHFGGYIEKFSGADGGATVLGILSIDNYLFKRLLADDDEGLTYCIATTAESPAPIVPQTRVATDLVNIARGPKGVPLIPVDGGSVISWTPCWQASEFKNIGEAIQEQVQSAGHLRYHLEHEFIKSSGSWVTRMIFTDSWGEDRGQILKSDQPGGGWHYSLDVDGKDEASRVYGVGDTTLALQSIAYDEDATLPELMVTQSWQDTIRQDALDSLTVGWLADHRDPVAVPAMTIAGMVPDPDTMLSGDIVSVDSGYGLITFEGKARILTQAWKLDLEEPVTRTLSLLPIIRSSQGLRLQTPKVQVSPTAPTSPKAGAPTTTPWPTPGLVTRVHPNYLHEISGMQGGSGGVNPDIVFVHNDNEVNEIGDPIGTVYMVSKKTGNVVGKWVQRSATQPHALDTECIRMRFTPFGPYTGRTLWLGDTGNNDNTTRGATPPRVYIIPEPVGGGNKGYLQATILRLNYPFGQRDAECLLINPVTGLVRIVTKENGKARVVNFGVNPTDNMTGTLEATITDGLDLVTDGDMTRDGKWALFRAKDVDNTLVYDVATWRRVGSIPTPAMPKSEGITVEGPCSFLVSTEAKPHAPINETETPIYRVLIPTKFGANCSSPTSGGTSGTSPTVVPGQVLNLTNWKLTMPI